jgi:methylmalonyl-CoA/ethylmalonyl-CoA epimerase
MAIQSYSRFFGISDWYINYVDVANGKGRNFRVDGEEVVVKAKIAWANVGEIELELIEPQDESSIYAEYLRNSGPGVHHLMFSTNCHQNTANEMRQHGIGSLMAGELQETEFRLFDTRHLLGTICEIATGGPLVADEEINSDIAGK